MTEKFLSLEKKKLFFAPEDFPEIFFETFRKGNNDHTFILPKKDNSPENISLLQAISQSAMKINPEENTVLLWKQERIPVKFLERIEARFVFIFSTKLFFHSQNVFSLKNKKTFLFPSLENMRKRTEYKKFTWNLLKKYYLNP